MQKLLVLSGDVEIDMEVSRVLNGYRVVQYDSQQNNQHKQPVVVYAILIGIHEVSP